MPAADHFMCNPVKIMGHDGSKKAAVNAFYAVMKAFHSLLYHTYIKQLTVVLKRLCVQRNYFCLPTGTAVCGSTDGGFYLQSVSSELWLRNNCISYVKRSMNMKLADIPGKDSVIAHCSMGQRPV
jgi:hypothetical protein